MKAITGYRDKQGRILFVSTGISGESNPTFATYFQKPNGALKRVVSKDLPVRETREEAEVDLERYARRNGFVPEVAD